MKVEGGRLKSAAVDIFTFILHASALGLSYECGQ